MNDAESLTSPTLGGLQSVMAQMTSLLPKLLAGFVLLALGIVLGYLAYKLFSSILRKFKVDVFLDNVGVGSWVRRFTKKRTPSQLIGWLFGVFIFLVFLMATVDALGLDSIAGLLDSFTLFLPRLFGAIIIFILGASLAQITFDAVQSTTVSLGIDYGRSVAEVARGLVLLITLLIALSQLQLQIDMLQWIVLTFCASIGLAAALAIGLGTRQLAGEIIAGVYLRELYQVGDRLQLADISGTLAVVGTVATRIVDSEATTITIPNSTLLKRRVEKLQ